MNDATVASRPTYFYEPRQGHGLKFNPFKAIIAPRPIGWISTVDAGGRPNLAPYSFFNAFSQDPPVIAFSSGGLKDSVVNAKATGEFVFNLCTAKHGQQMNVTSEGVAHGINEFEMAGLVMAASRLVRPPYVADSPAVFECKVVQILELKDLDGNFTDNYVVFGQAIGIHLDPRYIKDGRFDTAAAQPLARCGYHDYAKVTEIFEMVRPPDER